MECKHKNKLNHANFCKTECYYCSYQIEAECMRKHPEYFKVSIHSVEDIRKNIIEAFFNNPKLGENYIDWHTENSGECGVTIMFKNANEEFDIIIRRK